MFAGFLITFREGLEAFLVIGIILSYLSKYNQDSYKKWIYLGVFFGLLNALLIGVLFQLYYTGFESNIGELYLKIIIMGFAVAVLTYMIIWMNKNSKNIKGELESNLQNAISRESIISLVIMAYISILREGFETVLFLGAIFGNEMDVSVFYGGILGLVIAFFVIFLLFKGMSQLPLKSFFKITGNIILVIAAGLLINMIGILQDINLVPVLKADLFDLSWFMVDSSEVGIFFKALFGYTHKPSLMQLLFYIGYFFFITFTIKQIGKHKEKTVKV